MKGKKLLASTLSAAMVLSTMAVPVFAADDVAEVSGVAYSTFAEAVAAAKAEDGVQTIKLLADTSIAKTDFYDSVDLNGKKLTFTASDSWLWADVTFSNGDIVANDLPTNGQGVFSATYGTLSFDRVNFECKNLPGGAYVIDAQQGTFTAKDSSFTIENFGGVAVFGGGGPSFVFDDTAINITDAEVGILHNAELKNGAVYNATRVNAPFQTGTDKEVKISGSTFTATDCDNIAMMKYAGSSLNVDEDSSVSVNNGAKVFASPECTVNAADLPVTTAPVTIGVKGYATLAEAFADAKVNETIKLHENITYSKSVSGANRITRAKELDLNGKILTLPDYDYNFGAITIKNGTIEVTEEECTGTGLIYQYDNDPITFDGVTINANNYSAEGYLFGVGGGCTFKNSTLNVKPTTTKEIAAIFSPNGDDTSDKSVVIEDSNINISNADTKIVLFGAATIKGSTEIDADIVNNHGFYLNDNGALTIEKTAAEDGSEKIPSVEINVSGTDRYAIYMTANTEYSVDEGIPMELSIYRAPAEDNLASAVRVSFADVTATNAEGEKVYDIYVEADSDETINRLTSAQLAIDVTPVNGDFEAVVSGTEKISVGKSGAMYHFNLDGITAADITGAKIKLGSVTVRGFGQFKLGITADNETIANQIHAVAIADNIITDYIVGGEDETTGTLILPETTEVTVAEATRKLTINVTFPNAINDNLAAYQAMKVTVKGGKTGATQEIVLGGEMADGAYTVVLDELVKGGVYNVTVTGDGYRTANYTVTMNEDKTLNFWNNVMDEATVVEVGEEASAKTVTFLAGELVKDGKINIYDLSAVVSYFGKKADDTETEWEFAKYDLDRNGKVDSKDVAFVLTSWGN